MGFTQYKNNIKTYAYSVFQRPCMLFCKFKFPKVKTSDYEGIRRKFYLAEIFSMCSSSILII